MPTLHVIDEPPKYARGAQPGPPTWLVPHTTALAPCAHSWRPAHRASAKIGSTGDPCDKLLDTVAFGAYDPCHSEHLGLVVARTRVVAMSGKAGGAAGGAASKAAPPLAYVPATTSSGELRAAEAARASGNDSALAGPVAGLPSPARAGTTLQLRARCPRAPLSAHRLATRRQGGHAADPNRLEPIGPVPPGSRSTGARPRGVSSTVAAARRPGAGGTGGWPGGAAIVAATRAVSGAGSPLGPALRTGPRARLIPHPPPASSPFARLQTRWRRRAPWRRRPRLRCWARAWRGTCA